MKVLDTLRRVAAGVLVALPLGCNAVRGGATDDLWRQANEPATYLRSIPGTISTPTGRCVVLQYHPIFTPDESEVLLVPLDPSGRPVSPFSLSDVDRQDLEYSALVPRLGRLRAASADHVGFGSVDPAAVIGVTSASSLGSDPQIAGGSYGPGADGDVVVLAYRLDRAGRLTTVPLEPVVSPGGGFQHFRVPDGTAVLFVPGAVPRPSGTRAGNRLRATCLTPLTLAADAVPQVPGMVVTVILAPIWVPVALLFIASGGPRESRPPSALRPTSAP